MSSPPNKRRKCTVPDNSIEEDVDVNFSDEEGTRVDGIYIPPPIKPVCSFDPTGPRLIITKIVNNFFKSYADEQTLGPFHKCFNAIIGPNGSGKSNVIDSMLFVFGYRATKIRCKKVSVLLHNSENYQNVQSATVAVHFAQIIDKEGDEYEIIPGSEFVVSRTAMKDNSSYYTLNGSRVHFKEVGVLLKKHGIDLDHNRFLILQGEVEQIAMMKCKGDNQGEPGMLEYLEDIIGTSRYIKPLEQLNERVETLSDAISEKVNRLRLVEEELEKLQKPMEEAVGYLKAENTVTSCKNILYQKNVFDLEEELEASEEENKLIQTAKDELLEKIESINKLKIEKEEILNKESEKYNSLQIRKNKLKEAFEKANNKDVELQAEMVQVNKDRKKTMELLAEEKKNLEQYERTPKESEKGIEECLKKVEKLSHKKEELDAEKTKLSATIKTDTKPLQEKKEILENELVELKKNVDETKSAYAIAESELKLCMTNEENETGLFGRLIEERKAEYDEAVEVAGKLQVQVDKLTSEIKEKTIGRMKKMDKTINGVVETINKLKAEVNRYKVAVKTAERNAKTSTKKISTMEQDIKNYENRLREMKAKRDEIGSDDEKLLKCLEEVENELNSGDNDFSEVKEEVDKLKKKLTKLKFDEVDINQKLKTAVEKISGIKATMHQWHVKISQLKLQEIPETESEELKKFTKEELEEKNMELVEKDLKFAENQLKSVKPNLGVIQEYRKKQDRYMERAKELDEISQKRQEVKNVYDTVRENRKNEFLAGFQTIRMKLKEMYQMITLGGDADFELVDTFDPFTEGIQFNVRPPKKSWKKISNLSGGEKTLSSLALVFALHYYKPSPLYVMDEIDAALDFKNVSIVGHYIKERTKNAQFIIISLRSQMFELCDHLVGIYKTYNCTKSIAIDPRIYDEKEEDQLVPTQPTQRLQLQGTQEDVVTENSNINIVTEASHSNDEEPEPMDTTTNAREDSNVIDDSFAD